MHAPTDLHWADCKCVLRYLKGTHHHGLQLRISPFDSLYVYIDADCAVNVDNNHSVSSCCVYFYHNLIS